jgi:sulfate-transporting ATPase
MITGQEQPDERRGQDRREREARLRRPEPRRPQPKNNVWEEVSDGLDSCSVKPRHVDPRLCRRLQLQGPRPAEEGRQAVGRRAQPRPHGQDAQARRQRPAARRAHQRPRRRDARALEEAIENFAGCAVVISHDRFFLDRLATHILAFEGDSHVEWFEGNFAAYEEDKKRRLGDEADRPHRMTYRKLLRDLPALDPCGKGRKKTPKQGEGAWPGTRVSRRHRSSSSRPSTS